MKIITLTPAEELHRLAGLASRMQTFMEDDAVILRWIAKHVAHQLDVLQADCDGKAGVILALERENAAWAIEVCRLQGVIRDLQNDLDMAMHENSRLESPDGHD